MLALPRYDYQNQQNGGAASAADAAFVGMKLLTTASPTSNSVFMSTPPFSSGPFLSSHNTLHIQLLQHTSPFIIPFWNDHTYAHGTYTLLFLLAPASTSATASASALVSALLLRSAPCSAASICFCFHM